LRSLSAHFHLKVGAPFQLLIFLLQMGTSPAQLRQHWHGFKYSRH